MRISYNNHMRIYMIYLFFVLRNARNFQQHYIYILYLHKYIYKVVGNLKMNRISQYKK